MPDEAKFILVLVVCVCAMVSVVILGDWLDGNDCTARVALLDPEWTASLICEDGTADVLQVNDQIFLRCTCPLETSHDQ